mgnify:CR=1 FL=1
MAINRIKTGGITDATIKSEDIAPGTIASDRLAGGITNAQLDGSIANSKLANSAITINGSSVSLGGSVDIVASTDWQAVTVADGSTVVNAQANQGLLLDTNAGEIEVIFPASPSRGDTIKIVDYAGHFNLNRCLVNLNGNNLESTTPSFFALETKDTLAEFIYIDSNKGWLFYQNLTSPTTPSSALVNGQIGVSPTYTEATGGTVATSGDFKIHTFTGDGTFDVTTGNADVFPGNPLAGPNTFEFLVVAGGGAGGQSNGGGGGGGGFRTNFPTPQCQAPLTLASGSYPITVGGGGAVTANQPDECVEHAARHGSNSILSTITSTGGGGGGTPGSNVSPTTAGLLAGGSGAGVGHRAGDGGSGNTPPVSPPQGNDAGNAPGPVGFGGSGGGGAGQAGGGPTNAVAAGSGNVNGGNGGNGTANSITGSSVTYSGGGGAGAHSNPGNGGTGGTGGGGNGGRCGTAATAATANTGGGGGGGSRDTPPNNCGTAGGKGIVIIRYKFQA